MNIYSLPSLICLLTMPFLGAFIYSRNRQSPVHRLFFLITVAISYWAFIEFNIRQALSYEAALFWTRAGSFKIMASPLLIHFILVYIDRWKSYNQLKAFSFIYLPAAILAVSDLFAGSINGFPVKEPWGWSSGGPVHPAVLIFYFTWKITALSFTTRESVVFLKQARIHERTSFALFFYGILVAVAFGIASTSIARIFRPGFPEVSIIVATLFAVYLTWIIRKYGLFLSPCDTADDIIELMDDGLILAGTRNQIVRVNNAILKLTGYSRNELYGKNISQLVEDPELQLIPRGNIDHCDSRESRIVSKTGQSISVLISRTTVFNYGKMPLAMVIMVKDLTFWHKSQQEFARAEKLESLQLIIRSIVHDFNNLLTSITGHLFLAEKSKMFTGSLRENVTNAEKATQVVINLTQRLASYAKENNLELSPCNLYEIINESADLVLKGTPVGFAVSSDDDLWLVNADRYRMIQIFINLFINAKQAMHDKGRITVECENHSDGILKECVKISVHDSGGGIPDDIVDRIFEPFFTTKPEGSGLGLSIVKNTVESHGGTVSVESRQNVGTTFTILLPKASAVEEIAVAVTESDGIRPSV